MATKILTLEEVAAATIYKGAPLTVQAIRYRIWKSNKAGHAIRVVKKMSPRRRLVDALTKYEADRLCRLWKHLHV